MKIFLNFKFCFNQNRTANKTKVEITSNDHEEFPIDVTWSFIYLDSQPNSKRRDSWRNFKW